MAYDLLKQKFRFIKNYVNATNAADGSKFDANANVEKKSAATMSAEIFKEETIYLNRYFMVEKIKEMFSNKLAKQYLKDLDDHIIYKHDETGSPGKPYCVSISMYPFLLNGLNGLGGESDAPKHLSSYVGGVINLVYAVSAQFLGAVALPEILLGFDYYAKKDYGDNYLETHTNTIKNEIQGLIYSINQPASNRGYQAAFVNFSLFDKYFFKSMFDNFIFPDGSRPEWESVNKLQKFFYEWLQNERKIKLLTFPVITKAMVGQKENPDDPNDVRDESVVWDSEFKEWAADRMKHGFDSFYYIGPATSLSSCCRLKNEIDDNTFSHTLGAGGVMTGSMSVMTFNIPRIAQICKRDNLDFIKFLRNKIKDVQKYQLAFKSIIEEFLDNNMLPVYDAGFITLDKQFLTLGIIGIPEAYQAISNKPAHNTNEYKEWCRDMLQVFTEENKNALHEYGQRFNTEQVPGESLGIKLPKWDKEDGFKEFKEYSSYFYIPSDSDVTISDKFILHGYMDGYLDGGAAFHMNLEELITDTEQGMKLIDIATRTGCSYWTANVKMTLCNSCKRNFNKTLDKCPNCGSTDIDYATRIIGYLKRVSSFSEGRRNEESKRIYHIT